MYREGASISHITSQEVGMLFGARRSDYLVSLWKVFIDDSADAHRRSYVIAGAFIGKVSDWQTFQRKWNAECRKHPRIRYFHSSECTSLQGEFFQFNDLSKWPKPLGRLAANQKRDKLRSLLNEDSNIVGLGVGVDVPEYLKIRESHPDGKRLLANDPYQFALQVVWLEAVKAIKSVDPKAKVAFVSDDSSQSLRHSAVYDLWKKKNPISAASMLGLAHLDDKHWPGLQAADMAAKSVKVSHDEFHRDGSVNKGAPLIDRFYRIGRIGERYLFNVLEEQSWETQEVEYDE